MKKDNHSQPYRNLGFDKIDAPNSKGKNEPKATRTTGGDLRVGGNKK